MPMLRRWSAWVSAWLGACAPAVAADGWYGGDAHMHTRFSDGSDTVAGTVLAARETGLSWVVITDHNTVAHHPALAAIGMPGFLAIGGEEITSSDWGHANALFSTALAPWTGSPQDALNAAAADGALTVLNHPYSGNYGWTDWSVTNYCGIEVWNGPTVPQDDNANARTFRQWNALLANGRRVFGFANSDAHTPNRVGTPRMHARLPALTVAALRAALAGGRFYGTNGPELDFTIEGRGMGETVTVRRLAPIRLEWLVRTAGALASVRLVHDGRTCREWTPPSAALRQALVMPAANAGWFRLEARTAEGGFAYTNPIWLRIANAETAVKHARIEVRDLHTDNDGLWTAKPSVDAWVAESSGDVTLTDGNRGDYELACGVADAPGRGVLIACAAERERPDPAAPATRRHGLASVALLGTQPHRRFYVPVHDTTAARAECNANVAVAYFPFAAGWQGGHAAVSANGGPLTVWNAAPGLRLGREFVDGGNGVFALRLPGVNGLTDGVLLACGGENEGNFALTAPFPDGSFRLYSHDNGANGGVYEQDGVAFVYVPLDRPGVVAGRVLGHGGTDIGTPGFRVAVTGAGAFDLFVKGHGPATGTLLVSAEGGGSLNVDNIVLCEPAVDRWRIETRDLPGNTLQNLGAERCFSFAFLPYPPAPNGTVVIVR